MLSICFVRYYTKLIGLYSRSVYESHWTISSDGQISNPNFTVKSEFSKVWIMMLELHFVLLCWQATASAITTGRAMSSARYAAVYGAGGRGWLQYSDMITDRYCMQWCNTLCGTGISDAWKMQESKQERFNGYAVSWCDLDRVYPYSWTSSQLRCSNRSLNPDCNWYLPNTDNQSSSTLWRLMVCSGATHSYGFSFNLWMNEWLDLMVIC